MVDRGMALRLTTPARNSAETGQTQPRELAAWLAHLPAANLTESARKIVERLSVDNRVTYPVDDRVALLEIYRVAADPILMALRNQRVRQGSVFSRPARMLSDLERALMRELSYGYKSALQDAERLKRLQAKDTNAVRALQRAVGYLIGLLLQAYSVYEAEPESAWAEVHLLYSIARERGVAQQPIPDDPLENSIERLYGTLAAISVGNPYHLMHGETYRVYDMLLAWSAAIRLQPPDPPGSIPLGRFGIRYADDAPPRFLRAGQQAPDLIIYLGGLLEHVQGALREIIDRHSRKRELAPLSLEDRLKRDLLRRLMRAWAGRTDRRHARGEIDAEAIVACGLDTAHYYAAGEKDFTPEMDELRIHQVKTGGNQWSLVPSDLQHWSGGQMEANLSSGLHAPRESQFDKYDPNLDVWNKIYATQGRRKEQEISRVARNWRVSNKSAGGLGLRAEDTESVELRVGDVVAFRPVYDVGVWRVGVVSWLRVARARVEAGLRALANDANAVALRCIQGAGVGSEYLRGLLIHQGKEARLITPATLYDVHSLLAVNLGKSMAYVRLTELIDASASFAMYAFKEEEMPEDERAKLAQLRGRKP